MPSRYPGAITQEWEPVVLRKPRPKSQALRDPKAVNQALRSGQAVQTVKKSDAGTNKSAAAARPARKVEDATEPAAVERIGSEVRLLIQKARVGMKMSQADLAKRINERPQVVQDYEAGRAAPNQAVLAKIEKALGVKLRGNINKH